MTTSGFTQSPTAYSIDGVPVNRAFARAARAINRKAEVKPEVDKWAEHKADGLMKIRAFHAKAGVRVVAYTESEMREVLIEAKDEFDRDGTMHTNTYMRLNTVGYDAAEILKLWTMLAKAEINMGDDDDDIPLNNFGDNEEPDNVE